MSLITTTLITPVESTDPALTIHYTGTGGAVITDHYVGMALHVQRNDDGDPENDEAFADAVAEAVKDLMLGNA